MSPHTAEMTDRQRRWWFATHPEYSSGKRSAFGHRSLRGSSHLQATSARLTRTGTFDNAVAALIRAAAERAAKAGHSGSLRFGEWTIRTTFPEVSVDLKKQDTAGVPPRKGRATGEPQDVFRGFAKSFNIEDPLNPQTIVRLTPMERWDRKGFGIPVPRIPPAGPWKTEIGPFEVQVKPVGGMQVSKELHLSKPVEDFFQKVWRTLRRR